MLSRLKGMETLRTGQKQPRRFCCAHVLSRLKGMETFCLSSFPRGIPRLCTCAFPLEGNGNYRMVSLLPSFVSMCTCAFPLEGNGNVVFDFQDGLVSDGAHVLSRLKGMETRGALDTQTNSYTSAHVLSRLKGMETLRRVTSHLPLRRHVHMCFPA